jgi:hypothetical protein
MSTGRRDALVRPEWTTFASWAESLTADDIRAFLPTAHDSWCLIRSLGPIDRERPVSFGVTGAAPFGSVELILSHPKGTLGRWDGYRYVGIGTIVPPDAPLAPETPYWRMTSEQVDVSVLLVAQWAGAEPCATFAQALWRPSEGRVDFITRTFGRPSTRREALLAQRGQELIAVIARRGRPLETPLRARARLAEAAARLSSRDKRGRRNLADATMLTTEGVDKLRQRALVGRLSDAVAVDGFRPISDAGNKVQTGRDQEG